MRRDSQAHALRRLLTQACQLLAQPGHRAVALDRIGTETEMGNGHAAGFLGIVSKVSLGVHIRVVANDFNGALVGADGTV